jgi:hypothetical protein
MTTNKNKGAMLVMALSLALFLDNCSEKPTQVGGGASGTEVSAEICGSVMDSTGRPVCGAAARLRPSDFLTDSSASAGYTAHHSILDTLTASDGQFTFCKVLPDSYDVEISLDDSLGVLVSFRVVPGTSLIRLLPDTLLRMGTIEGNVVVEDAAHSIARLQVYGMQLSVLADSTGHFSINLPPGRHVMHLGARLSDSLDDTSEFDGMDIALAILRGEQRDLGSFTLVYHPPVPCQNISCDSTTVLHILSVVGIDSIQFDSVCTVRNGRVVGVNLRGLSVPQISLEIAMLDSLEILDVGKTGLAALPIDMGRLRNLTTLRCDGNSLTAVPQSLGELTSLRQLDLSGNGLDSLPDTLAGLDSLTTLNLSNNKLCQLDSLVQAWANRFDSGWESSQQCP